MTGNATALAAPGELVAGDAVPVAVPEVCEPVGDVAEEVGGRVEAAEAREARIALLAGAAAWQKEVTWF